MTFLYLVCFGAEALKKVGQSQCSKLPSSVSLFLSELCTWGFSAGCHCSIHFPPLLPFLFSYSCAMTVVCCVAFSVFLSLYPEPTCPESLHSGVWSYRYSLYCISMSLSSIAWGLGYREGKSSVQVKLHTHDTPLHRCAHK